MDDYVMQIREAKAEFEEDLRMGKGTQKGNEAADLFGEAIDFPKNFSFNNYAVLKFFYISNWCRYYSDRFEHFVSSGSYTEVSVTRHRLIEGMSASDDEISYVSSRLTVSSLLFHTRLLHSPRKFHSTDSLSCMACWRLKNRTYTGSRSVVLATLYIIYSVEERRYYGRWRGKDLARCWRRYTGFSTVIIILSRKERRIWTKIVYVF